MLAMNSLWGDFHDRESHRDRLSMLLSTCRKANATLAVGKIYAFVGLSSDCSDFATHYDKSKPEVYLRFAVWHICRDEGKELLYEAARSDRTSGDLSSRIPDWSEVPTHMNLGQQWSRTSKRLFSAGVTHNREGPKETIQSIKGFIVSTTIGMEAENALSVKGFILHTILILGHPKDPSIQGAPIEPLTKCAW
jgi:hypothetical protein